MSAPEIRTGAPAELVAILAADLEAHARLGPLRGRFTIAIPGGSVATTCFPRLSTLALDWPAIEFFWVDERAVPPDDPASNFGRARALWLDPAGVPGTRVHRMRGEAADLEGAARGYAAELTAAAGDPPRLDYVLLGVGPDGHVASLFPGHPALGEAGPALAIADAPMPPPRRLSLALPVLAAARRVAIVAFGETKARLIREALADPDSMLPVAQVARGATSTLVLIE